MLTALAYSMMTATRAPDASMPVSGRLGCTRSQSGLRLGQKLQKNEVKPARPEQTSLLKRLYRLYKRLETYSSFGDLYQLSDHQLLDIGLHRSDLPTLRAELLADLPIRFKRSQSLAKRPADRLTPNQAPACPQS